MIVMCFILFQIDFVSSFFDLRSFLKLLLFYNLDI